MILKVRAIDGKTPDKWHFFDNIRNSQVGLLTDQDEGAFAGGRGTFIFVNQEGEAPHDEPIVEVSWFDPDDLQTRVLFYRGCGYLMNDDGKTVERL